MTSIQETVQKVAYIREAAIVGRLHTFRLIGEYTVGSHSFGMLALLRVLWPEAPKELIWAILEHDLPERLIGDIPSPSINNGGFIDKDALARIEEKILESVLGETYFSDRTMEPELHVWLKGLDYLDLWLFCIEQAELGNKTLGRVRDALSQVFHKNLKNFPEPILSLFWEIEIHWKPESKACL